MIKADYLKSIAIYVKISFNTIEKNFKSSFPLSYYLHILKYNILFLSF